MSSNEFEKFSPEWFAEESKTAEYAEFDREAATLRQEFVSRFGADQLKQLTGRDILTTLFYNDGDNKQNLCYMLEMHKRVKEIFGSISGGSAYKFGLFYHKKNKCWTSGSPVKPIELTEEGAIEIAAQIRDGLVEGAAILSANSTCNSREDYEALYEKIKHISGIDTVWVLKYYQMLFPDLLPVFYGRDIQIRLLNFLHITPSDIPFVRMGQISLFIKKCNITSMVFGQISYPYLDAEAAKEKKPDALADGDIRSTHYWLYSPGEGAANWDDYYSCGIMAIGWSEIGDLSQFDSREAMKQAMKTTWDDSKTYKIPSLATWQFANEMRPGDVVFAKRGRDTLIGRGVVVSDYQFDASADGDNKNIREVRWTHNGQWEHPGMAAMKTLTDIKQYTEYVATLNNLFDLPDDSEDEDTEEVVYPAYSAEDFLEEVFMEESDYRSLVAVLKNKKNIILQGAPGVGKTFAAKRLAYSIMGKKDKERVMMVQFHQSYSYEDFIMGFRPSSTGFELKKGAFYNFCKLAEADSDNDYFFIIDEINRGNLSKIFGELFMLIETDKRGIELQLLYSDERFSVPANVYIIGMMNTADRSLAMLDYALRRRFAFIDLRPGFDTDGFRTYRMALNSEKFNRLITVVGTLNNVISQDESLGDGFCIGHSYFCNLQADTVDDQQLHSIVEYELVPLLKEYWFDEPTKVRDWSNNLRSAIK